MAAPTEVTVRIEGKERTLFEGPILTEGHDVRATSDTEPRRCDGTNNGLHVDPVPTPTTASADAIEMVGGSFDGIWSDGFDDYFVEQWGPDREDLEAGQFWGVLVNGVFTPVGGCQYALGAGDEALWVYDAFSERRLLWLAAASDPTVAPLSPRPTAHVEVGQPLSLVVDGYSSGEGTSAEVEVAAGVTVAPVETDPVDGSQSVDTGNAEAVMTAADGTAEITFAAPGWHRIKAQEEAGFIRSNRLDVCVEPVGGGSCGPLPADAALRIPARYQPRPPEERPSAERPSEPTVKGSQQGPSSSFVLRRAVLDRRAGTATLVAELPGPGHLTLGGAKVRGLAIDAGAAGPRRLAIRPTPRALRALRRQGTLRVTLQIAFTPTGGATSADSRQIVLKLKPAPK